MAASLYQFDQQTKNFYEKSPFPIMIYQLVDSQYQVLLLSEGYCNMVKSGRASMMAYLDQHNLSRVHPEDRSRLRNFIWQVDQKKAHRLTYRLSIEGHYHQLLAYCKTQIDNGIKLFIVHYFDITTNGQKLADQISPYVKQKTDQVDKLTGLKQIGYFEAYGATFLKKLLAKNESAAFVLVDVNHMRAYNEKFGYEQGDQLLQQLAQSMRSLFPHALIARYFQDQFIILTANHYLSSHLKQLTDSVKKTAADQITSIRYGIYVTSQAELPITALDKARVALIYNPTAKPLHYYSPRLQEQVSRRDYVLGHFMEALEKGWITVTVQPIINLMSKNTAAFELLSRWNDPVYGTLYPKDFLPVLEENHLTDYLDSYIIKESCKIWHKRYRQQLQTLPMVFNLTITDLENKTFFNQVKKILQEYQLPRQFFYFDLAIPNNADPDLVQEQLLSLRKDGFKYAFDLASSSYSITDALIQFTFDFLKFDMMTFDVHDPKSTTILASIVTACKHLGVRPLFKNIESQNQVDFIQSIGGIMMQGNYLAKPLPFASSIHDLSRQGFPPQRLADRDFYRELNLINVLDPNAHFFDQEKTGLMAPVPVMVYLVEDGHVKLGYMNGAGQKLLTKLNGNLTNHLALLNGRKCNNALRFWDTIASCTDTGDTASYTIVDQSFRYRMVMQLVAKSDRCQAFLSTISEQPSRLLTFAKKDQEELAPESLWQTLTNNIKIGLFWKDQNWRFLGANQQFLDYYGVSLLDLVGRTDEELGFNIKPENFRSSEQQVLDEGVSVRERGKTLARGKVRDILAFKAPVYQDGKIAGLMGLFIDTTKNSQRLAQLENEASQDALTKLQNRHSLSHNFAYLTGRPLFVLMIDIDFFKEYNDTFGHCYGDEILKKISQNLLKIYGIGNCYRYGGDEFLVIGDFSKIEDIKAKDWQLRQALEKMEILDINLTINISVGYCYGKALTKDELEGMIHLADHNLYKVKDHGRCGIDGSRYLAEYE